MGLLQRIRKWRAHHRIAKKILDGVALYTTVNAADVVLEQLADVQTPIVQEARADFYDGMRGPQMFQLDQRLMFDGKGGLNYTLLPKVFVDVGSQGNKGEPTGGLFAVTPLNYSPGTKPAFGAGVGGYVNFGNVGLLGVVATVHDLENEITNVNPQLYATIIVRDFLLDPRVSYLLQTGENGVKHTLSFGATLGYQVDNVIIGADVESSFDPSNPKSEQLEKGLKYQLMLRVDLDSQHKNWIQAYVGKDAAGIGFRSNFK